MRKLLLCLLLFLPSYAALLRADTLHLRNGEILEGVFLGIQNGYYKFKTQAGEILCVPRQDLVNWSATQDPNKTQPLAKDEGDSIICGAKGKEKKEEKTPELSPESKKTPPIPVLPTDKPPIKKTPPASPPQIQKDKLESDPQNKKEIPKLEGGPKEELEPKPEPEPKAQDEKKIPKLEDSPKEELDLKPQPKPQTEKEIPELEKEVPKLGKEVPKLDEEVPENEIEPEDLAETETEEEIPKDKGPGFLSRSWNSVKNFFRKLPGRLKRFYKQYMYPLQFSLSFGSVTLKTIISNERETVSYEELGTMEDIEGTLDIERPNQHTGSGLRLSLTKELLRDRFYPKLALLTGLDWSFASNVKGDRPLRASGLVTFAPISGVGEERFTVQETDYSYSYNYVTLFAGPSYYFLKYSSASLVLRLPFSGSFSEEQSTEIGNSGSSGNVQGLFGFGLILSHRFPWPKEHNLTAQLFYSHDEIDFKGVVYSSTFLGLGASIEF